VFNDKQDPHPHDCICPDCYEIRRWFTSLMLSNRLRDEPEILEIAQLVHEAGFEGTLQQLITEARRLYDPDT